MQYAPTLHFLSNGLPVLLDPMDIATVSMSVSFHTGARDEAPNEYGITHFIEHMLIKGTARFPNRELLKNYVWGNGGGTNASTSKNVMTLYGRILAENFYILADALADQVQNSLFDAASIDNERRVILDELSRALDNSGRQFSEFRINTLFKDTGWAHIGLGSYENLGDFTRDQMLAYYARMLSAKNIIIGISGKFDADAVLKDLEKLYGKIPCFDRAVKTPLVITPAIAHKLKSDQKNVKLSIAFQEVCPWKLENRYQNFCVECFESVLGFRLVEQVRSKNGLVYGISVGAVGDEFISANTIDTECDPKNLEKVVAVIAKTCFDIMYKNPVTSAELAREKILSKFEEANWMESAEKRKNKLIGFYRKYGLVYDLVKDRELRQGITTSDIQKYTRDYFSNPLSFITMGPDFDLDLKRIWDENFN